MLRIYALSSSRIPQNHVDAPRRCARHTRGESVSMQRKRCSRFKAFEAQAPRRAVAKAQGAAERGASKQERQEPVEGLIVHPVRETPAQRGKMSA